MQPYMINRTCVCLVGFFWNSTDLTCTACSAASDKASCSLESCYGFFWTSSKCHNCKTFSEEAGTNLVPPPADSDGLAIDGNCECVTKFLWNSTTFKCDECKTKGVNECGLGACSDFFWKGKSCAECPSANTSPRDEATPLTACKCNTGYLWSNISSTCVQCPASTSIINPKTGVCLACGSLEFGTNEAVNGICKCKPGYEFINGTCTCNSDKFLFDKGGFTGCGNCSTLSGGKTYNSTTKGCNCINGSSWSASLKKCKCNSTGTFMSQTSCVACSSLGAGRTKGSSMYKPDECTCADGLEWNFTLKTCVCKRPTGSTLFPFFNNKTLKCGLCDDTVFANKTVAGPNPTSCACPPNMMWSANTSTCVCDGTSVIGLNNFECINCKTTPGGRGNKSSSLACNCNPGWTWNSNKKGCACNNRTCPCPAGSVIDPTSGVCIACSKISSRSNSSLNNTHCICQGGYVWNANLFTCSCPSTSASSTNVCRACDTRTSSKNLNSSTKVCNCMTGYVWNATSFKCDFVAQTATNSFITLLNGTKVACKGLGSSTGNSIDNFNCECAPGFVWRDYNFSCVECVNIAFVNKTDSKYDGFSCRCLTGYFWDVASFSCKV